MIKFKTGFVDEFLYRNYFGIDFGSDSFDELYAFCPSSWCWLLEYNLKFHAL